jgi:hypothetical protein
MAGMEQIPTQQICDEPLVDENGEPTGEECGQVHMSASSPTCPECRWRLTDAFWASMGMTTPDTGARPAEFAPRPAKTAPAAPAPSPKRKRPGKRSRARKENDHG